MKKLIGFLIIGSSVMAQAAYANCATSKAYDACTTECNSKGDSAQITSTKVNGKLNFSAENMVNGCDGNSTFKVSGYSNALDAKGGFKSGCRVSYCKK